MNPEGSGRTRLRCFEQMIDTDNAVIMDVESSRSIRQGEVGAAKAMIERTKERFGIIVDQMESILEKHADATYDARQIMVKG